MNEPGHGDGGRLDPALAAALELEPHRRDFDDPALEWRRLFSELLGTFFLVLVAAGAGMVDTRFPGSVPGPVQVVVPGLMVLAIILFMGAVSGAHLNPAVTLAFALRGDFPWRRVPGYIVIQLIAAALACWLLIALIGDVGGVGGTHPGTGVTAGQAFVIEAILTLGLVSTILGTASRAQNVGAMSALAVGSYIALAGLWAAPLSGASMNPARSFGPALLSGNWTEYWVYVAGPLLGAAAAVGCAYVLRSHGGGRSGTRAAQGTLPNSTIGPQRQRP